MQFSDYEKALIEWQEVGLELNEAKKLGQKEVSIECYEEILDKFINLLRYSQELYDEYYKNTEQLNSIVEELKKQKLI